ncbi:hypothetical protein D3C86_1787950 [compost metagenome]
MVSVYFSLNVSVSSGISFTKIFTAKLFFVNCFVARICSIHFSAGRSPRARVPKQSALVAAATIAGVVTPNIGACIMGYSTSNSLVILFFQFMIWGVKFQLYILFKKFINKYKA